MENRSNKNILRIVLAVLLCLIIVAVPMTVMLVTRDAGDTPSDTPETHPDITISVVVSATRLFSPEGDPYREHVAKVMGEELYGALHEGHVLDVVQVTMPYGTSVMDATKEVLRANDISLAESNGYISAIAGLAHKVAGTGSGWVYTVDGEVVMLGASTKRLTADALIEWKYIVGDR